MEKQQEQPQEQAQEQPKGQPRYAYFTVPYDGPDAGFVCVRLERERGAKHCSASFSFCSPMDAAMYLDNSDRYRFRDYKPLARKIADARARTKRVKATIEFDHDGPMGEAFRKALELSKTTERAYAKATRSGKPRPTIAPQWFRNATKVEFGLVQPEEEEESNRMDRGDPPA